MAQCLIPIPIKFYSNVSVIINKSFSSDFLSSSLLLIQRLLHMKPRFHNAKASMDAEMLISYPRHKRNHTYLFQGRPQIGYNTEIWVGQCNQMSLFKFRKNLGQVCKDMERTMGRLNIFKKYWVRKFLIDYLGSSLYII